VSAEDGADVALSSLTLGERVGSGGQGDVHAVMDGSLLYKAYKEPSKVNGTALADLVALRQGLGQADRSRLDTLAAWPLCRVVGSGRVLGFLMRRAPSHMTWRTSAGSTKLVELQYLIRPPKAAWQDVVQPNPDQRRALALTCVEAISWFHDAGLVIGDISQANVLWSLSPEPAVHFLDCDGFRRVGRPAVQDQAATPDWSDPLAPSTDATVDTDAYKTALVAGRIVTQQPYVTPGQDLQPVPGCLNDRQTDRVRTLFAQAAGERGTRPKPSEWQAALGERGVITLTAATPRVRPAIDHTVLDGVRDRTPIRLRGPLK
jgi:DNA-binding helix-hairpin-helix protein with protein kinase domain